jgi:hypothetical protein
VAPTRMTTWGYRGPTPGVTFDMVQSLCRD